MEETSSTSPMVEFVTPEFEFAWEEYIVFGLVLVSSMGIGIFYGCFGKKNKTNEEFLMAGRSMGVFPVALSLICSFVSAIALLGFPVEVYLYGTQFTTYIFSCPLLTILLVYLYVPVYIRLRLTSAYEYLEWRFSKKVRILCSVFSIIYMLAYMPTSVFGPSLALDQVAGINQFVSCAAIFLVCIAYSSLGGLKAVLWTDVLQGIVMLVSLLAIIIAGLVEVGGFSAIFERNRETNRISFSNVDVDPRTRHTLWTSIIGGLAFWLPIYAATQPQIQRYNSVSNLRTARKTLIINMFGLMTIMLLSSWIGMTIFAKYILCDPISAKFINSPDQLLPFFVMDVLGKYPGLPGLLVGGLTCGTLSTISSALNSLTATIIEDFVKYYRPNLPDQKLTVLSKIISTVCGIVAFLFVFPIAAVNNTIQIAPFATMLAGCLLGPIFGAFTLGMFFPWTNELGTLSAMGISVGICGFQGIGSILAGRVENKLPNQKLFLTTVGCEVWNGTSSYTPDPMDISFDYTNPWKEREDSWEIQIWSISYVWLPGIGIGSTIILGLIFSAIVNMSSNWKKRKLVPERLFSFPLLHLWQRVLGVKYLRNWIEPDEHHSILGVGHDEKPISDAST